MRELVFSLICGVLLWGQQDAAKPEKKASVEGQILNAVTGEPVKAAEVTLHPVNGGQPYRKVTSAEGRFSFPALEPGTYRLSAQRTGFVWQNASNRKFTTLEVEAGQRLRKILLKLTAHAVIAGRVVDEEGSPAANVGIQALQFRYQDGKRKLSGVMAASTNDLGEYRMSSLAPGRYYLRATPRLPESDEIDDSAPEETYAPVYYPGALDLSGAVPIEVSAGAELHGTDMRLRKARAVRIRGRVIYPALKGSPRVAMIMLSPRDSTGFGDAGHALVQDSAGKFEIRGVLPGSYVLDALSFDLSGDPNDETTRWSAKLPVEVGNIDLEGITLVIRPAQDLAGVVKTEGRVEKQESPLYVALTAPEMFGQGPHGVVKADGSFLIRGVRPERYRVYVPGMPENAYLKSARLGDIDALENGLDLSQAPPSGLLRLVISAGSGQVAGVVLDGAQQPTPGVTVVLAPESKDRGKTQLFKTVAADQNGRFVLRGIPPGEYRLFSWDDVEEGAYQDPGFLKKYEKLGEPVKIRENGRETVQLKLIPAESSAASGN